METDKIIVWGIGAETKKLIQKVGVEQVIYFADNNEQLWGQYYFEKRILSLDEISILPKNFQIVISSVRYEEEIRKQLQENGFQNCINGKQYIINWIFNASWKRRKRIILLNSHDNINVGDHAITIAELYFFRKYLPEYAVVEIPLSICTKELNYVSKFVRSEDLLIVTGGGFLGSLWLSGGERNVRKIIRKFPNNKIVIFPQTMYFDNTVEGNRQKNISKRIYNLHEDLTFCFRDYSSYCLGMELLNSSIQKKYVPDMVTLLDRSDEIYRRKGVLMCIRRDKERVISNNLMKKIEMFLKKNNYPITKMSMLIDDDVVYSDRMDMLNIKLRQVQISQMVITDRLHCMLFCAISGTPCLAFDNISGKVRGAYDWISKLPYIRLAQSDMNFEREIEQLLNMPPMVYKKESVEIEFEKLACFLKSKKARIYDSVSEIGE